MESKQSRTLYSPSKQSILFIKNKTKTKVLLPRSLSLSIKPYNLTIRRQKKKKKVPQWDYVDLQTHNKPDRNTKRTEENHMQHAKNRWCVTCYEQAGWCATCVTPEDWKLRLHCVYIVFGTDSSFWSCHTQTTAHKRQHTTLLFCRTVVGIPNANETFQQQSAPKKRQINSFL